MPEENILLEVAEVAVAFAGFASLVGILGRSTSHADPRVLSLRMRAMLLTSLIVVGATLVPVILDVAGAVPHLAWTVSSLLLLVTVVVYGWWLQQAIIFLGREGLTPTRFQRRIIIPVLLLTLLVATVLLFANLIVALPAIYLTALGLLLFQSGFAFTLIVFSFLPKLRHDGED